MSPRKHRVILLASQIVWWWYLLDAKNDQQAGFVLVAGGSILLAAILGLILPLPRNNAIAQRIMARRYSIECTSFTFIMVACVINSSVLYHPSRYTPLLLDTLINCATVVMLLSLSSLFFTAHYFARLKSTET